jgi:hypothetical protein
MCSLGTRPCAARQRYCSSVNRKKDLIICGGYNVYLREVEKALHERPAQRGLWFSYGQLRDQLVDDDADPRSLAARAIPAVEQCAIAQRVAAFFADAARLRLPSFGDDAPVVIDLRFGWGAPSSSATRFRCGPCWTYGLLASGSLSWRTSTD